MKALAFISKATLFAAAIAACGLATGTARADVVGIGVAPNGLVNLTGEAAANLANETLLGTDQVNLALGNPLISANLNNAVFRNSAGLLDFVFQLSNNANSVALQSVDLNNYGIPGLTTSVNYLTGALPANAITAGFVAGTTNPTQVQRGPGAGNDLLFQFDTVGLAPGATSSIFFIHTNATTFNNLGTGQTSAVTSANGGATFVTKFEPTNAVPEPSMFAMIGVAGAFGLGYYRKHRRNKAAA